MSTNLSIDGELTVFRVHELRDELLAAMAAADGGTLQLDLGAVTEMDGAGLQLLIAARREAENRGTRLLLGNTPPRVAAVLQLTRLSSDFATTSNADLEP